MKRTLETRNPAKLKIHPGNAPLYGNVADPKFIEHVKKYGIISPLLITADDLIIGGHRRRQAALNLKIDEVPVIVLRDDLTEDEIMLLLLADNQYREKSTETRAREFQLIIEIEERQAKERQKLSQGRGKKGPENVPDLLGDARDLAAKKVGMSGKTAEKAAAVVKEIDKAEAAGETEKAGELRETLNKSVSKAHEAIRPKPKKSKAKQKQTSATLVDGLFKSHIGHVARGITAVAEANGGEGAQFKRADGGLNQVIDALKKMRGGAK